MIINNNDSNLNSSRMQLEEVDPRIALAARTRERLARFGIINLRMHDVYSLKRVQLSPELIAKCPMLQRAAEEPTAEL